MLLQKVSQDFIMGREQEQLIVALLFTSVPFLSLLFFQHLQLALVIGAIGIYYTLFYLTAANEVLFLKNIIDISNNHTVTKAASLFTACMLVSNQKQNNNLPLLVYVYVQFIFE